MRKKLVPRRRVRIEEGIYRDRENLLGVVQIGSRLTDKQVRRKRFRLGTDLQKIRAWRHHERGDLLETVPRGPSSGSLAAAVPVFLNRLALGRRREDFRMLLAHWSASPLGDIPREEISRDDIIQQLARWEEAQVAVSTRNHRLRALRTLYHALDGVETPNPTDKIKKTKEPPAEIRSIPMPLVILILSNIPDRGRPTNGTRPTYSELKIRLQVMAWTGMPSAQLLRLQPRHVDFSSARIYLQPRRKGKGARGAWVSLMPPAVDALRAFAIAQLWGRPWSRSSMRKSWRGAIRRTTAQLTKEAEETGDRAFLEQFMMAVPPHCRPYDLRHSFATEAYRLTGELRAVAELLQHATLETTKRYTEGAVSERVVSAIDKMTAAWKAIPPPAPTPPRVKKHGLKLVARPQTA